MSTENSKYLFLLSVGKKRYAARKKQCCILKIKIRDANNASFMAACLFHRNYTKGPRNQSKRGFLLTGLPIVENAVTRYTVVKKETAIAITFTLYILVEKYDQYIYGT